MVEKKKCNKCGKDKPITQFYNTNSQLSSDGKLDTCKDCLKSIIDCDDLDTVYSVLQLMNLPFLVTYWYGAKEKNPENPWSAYIRMANSKINEFKNSTWKDSIFENENIENISENSKQKIRQNEQRFYSDEWRGNYSNYDLEYLEDYYKDLKLDFKIVTKNHKDYAKKIAKASLAMDKAYEDMLNGVAGSDKRYKDLKDTFDSLSKSAQFSENTRGANEIGLGCFGVLFDKVEQKKWIPQHIPLEKDDYDKLIEYFSTIDKSI